LYTANALQDKIQGFLKANALIHVVTKKMET